MASKGEILSNVVVEHFASEGKSISKIDGAAIFIEGVIPGDVIDLRIIRKKKNYLEARPVRIIKYSEDRSDPFCDHFGLCGGCKWQHLKYEKQLEYKEQQVRDQLERIAKIANPAILPIIPSNETTYYRNKLEYTFSANKWLTSEQISSGESFDRRGLGFHIPKRFDKIVDIQKCYLQADISNKLRNTIREYAIKNNLSFYDIHQRDGLLRNLIIRTTSTDELMVIMQFGRNEKENIDRLMSFLKSEFSQITSLYFVINSKGNETYFDLDLHLFSGYPVIKERLGHIEYQIGPKSFFQTNTSQALEMYQRVREMAKLTGKEVVYDLYTGAGTIANFIANDAAKIIGIDNVPEAIEDAKINAVSNNIDNTTFISGDIKETLNEEMFHKFGQPEVLIIDPPRAGMHPKTTTKILEISPDRIVYVSCNPATQARDIEVLKEKYLIGEIQPIDMFPHTHHVENIISLLLKESDDNK